MTIHLLHNQLGSFNIDGSIQSWPERDILDRVLDSHNHSIKPIDGTLLFYVLGPNQEQFVDEIELPDDIEVAR